MVVPTSSVSASQCLFVLGEFVVGDVEEERGRGRRQGADEIEEHLELPDPDFMGDLRFGFAGHRHDVEIVDPKRVIQFVLVEGGDGLSDFAGGFSSPCPDRFL